MNATSFPPNSLYARLHGTAPDHTTSIPIPRDLATAWSPGTGSEARHDPSVKYGAAAIVLVVAIGVAVFVLA